MKIHLHNKRDEIIWALSLQDYSYGEIGEMFKLNPSTIMRIIKQRPANWKTKWIKKQ
jgi:DNA-directed RNA polymerase specialized sigma24 family protein